MSNIFLQNKYTKYYYNIVSNALARTLSAEVYTEKHHIIPKSLGGSNDKTNLVILTAREHFICHWLLTKMLTNISCRKMKYALSIMKASKTNSRYQTKITSRVFENIRKGVPGTAHTSETKEKIGNANKGNIPWNKGKTGVMSVEARAKISLAVKNRTISEETKLKHRTRKATSETKEKIGNAQRGKVTSAETKAKMSAAAKGRTFSDETRAKMSIAKQGRPGNRQGTIVSDETKAKLSLANKGKIGLAGESNGMFGVVPWNKNKAWSDETRAKMSASAKQRHQKNKVILP